MVDGSAEVISWRRVLCGSSGVGDVSELVNHTVFSSILTSGFLTQTSDCSAVSIYFNVHKNSNIMKTFYQTEIKLTVFNIKVKAKRQADV